MNQRKQNHLTKVHRFLTWFNLVWAVGVLILLLAMFLTSCSAPPYTGSTVAAPTKGKPLEYYNMGKSDAVKAQYWIARNLQMEKRKSEQTAYQTRYYTFNIQPDPQANINKVPYNITLPILE